MARFVLFLILLVPLTMLGDWLLGHPGEVRIDWLGYEITMHTAIAVLLVSMACLLAVLLAIGLWQLANWPDRRRARRRYRTLSKGLQHITHGMTALALGDESGAESALKKARHTLPGEPLPQLLTAQLLQRQGNQEAARSHFHALLAHASTATLATHRLIEQHLARREWAEAAAQAEEAQRDTPRDRWMILTLIDLYARLGSTSSIKALTEGWHWQSPLSKAERHRYVAIAYLLGAPQEATPRAKLTALRHAHGYAPDLLPATLAYAEALIEADQHKAARKVLRRTWEHSPAVILIAPILRSLGPISPRQQQRLLAPFLKGDTATHHVLAAQHALAVGEFPRARSTAEQALALEESKQACAIIAEAEKQMHGAEAASGWMARAMDAPRGTSWICQRCGSEHAVWQPHCQSCDAFDSLRYERPEARITSVDLPATA